MSGTGPGGVRGLGGSRRFAGPADPVPLPAASPATPCWRREEFVVARECGRCSGFEVVSAGGAPSPKLHPRPRSSVPDPPVPLLSARPGSLQALPAPPSLCSPPPGPAVFPHDARLSLLPSPLLPPLPPRRRASPNAAPRASWRRSAAPPPSGTNTRGVCGAGGGGVGGGTPKAPLPGGQWRPWVTPAVQLPLGRVGGADLLALRGLHDVRGRRLRRVGGVEAAGVGPQGAGKGAETDRVHLKVPTAQPRRCHGAPARDGTRSRHPWDSRPNRHPMDAASPRGCAVPPGGVAP